jgi:hypothetical protein
VSDGWIRATGAAFAVYGIVMLLRRERFAEWAARSHVRTARILPFFYPGRSKELESQMRLWRVGIIPLALFFVAFGLLLLASPAWLTG